jgi:transcriptional regulator with XRE-family HTH domain
MPPKKETASWNTKPIDCDPLEADEAVTQMEFESEKAKCREDCLNYGTLKMGAEMKAIRTKAGLSGQQVADELNMAKQAISHWETGKGSPEFKTLLRYAALMKIRPGYLVDIAFDHCTQCFQEKFVELVEFRMTSTIEKIRREAEVAKRAIDLETEARIAQLTVRF